MRSSDNDFPFHPNFNFGVDNLLSQKNSEQGVPYPPVSGSFILLDGTFFELLDGSQFLLL